jgi:hypothetical protein
VESVKCFICGEEIALEEEVWTVSGHPAHRGCLEGWDDLSEDNDDD